ncbi:MAG: tRNA guanosine(34) transglycosylase Tgt [archaeon]
MALKSLKTLHGKLRLPAFFPDATYGKIKSIDMKDLERTKTQGVVVNAYHLFKKGMVFEIEKSKGIHNYIKFQKPIISDSGGFQVMSLIHKSPELGRIIEKGAIFNDNGNEIALTPEKCIEIQLRIGSDIVMCLDECTKPELKHKEQLGSVERTIRWAKRCRIHFDKLTKNSKKKPLLFVIIQGGENKKLRKKCAEELLKLNFDGYSFGGWPVRDGKLLKGILKYTADLIPEKYPKYAMGIGKPQDIIECVKLGYTLFDCVIPTREARHKRIYIFNKNPKKNLENSFSFLKINLKSKNDRKKISNFCDCELCLNYNRKELFQMFKKEPENAKRLSTIHNLRFYSVLMGLLGRKEK